MNLKKLKLFYKYPSSVLLGKRYPFYLDFRITNRCNLNCSYCDINERKCELKKEEIFSFIDKIEDDCFFIVISGGEPLLREDIGEIIDYIQEKEGIYVMLCSNGNLFEKKLNDIRNVDSVVFSLDGEEKIHDKFRGKGSYKRVIKAINSAKKQDFLVFTTTVLHSNNLDQIDFILDKAKKMEFSCFFQPVINYKKNKGLVPSLEEFKLAVSKLIEKKKENPNLINNSLSNLKYHLGWPNHGRDNKYCGKNYFFLDSNGDLYPCFGSIGKTLPVNLKEHGKDVFDKVKLKNCNSCWCLASIEIESMFRLNFEAIGNLLHRFIIK